MNESQHAQLKRVSRREFLALAGGLASVATLAACAPGVAPGGAPGGGSTAEPEVRFMHPLDPVMVDPANKLFAKFEAEHHIKIKYEPLPGEDFSQKVVAAMAAGTAPDVIWGWGPHMRLFIEKEGTLNLDPFIEKDFTKDVINDFVESQWKMLQWKNQQHGLPQYCGIWGWYYNKRIFDAAGVPYPTKDMDATTMLEAAQKLTKRAADGKPEQLGIDIFYALEFTVSTHIWSWGGEVHDPNNNRICKLDDPVAMEAMQWLADLRWKHKVTSTPAEFDAMKTIGWGLFATDKVATKCDGSWALNVWLETVGNKFDWDVFPQYKGPGKGKAQTFHTTDTWVVYNKTKNPDAAWAWLKFATDKEWQRMQMETRLIQPARKSLGPEWADIVRKKLVAVNPKLEKVDLQVFIDGFTNARPMVQFAEHTKAMEILNPVFQQIYETGKGTVQDLIPEATKKVNDLLAKQG
ncbi:MAG: sugar ABC transporter substrate-binding protein [Caldilineaceae bacterium]